MPRVFLTVLDGVGIGALPDAADYGDTGAHTLAHALEGTGIALPNLRRMGLFNIEGAVNDTAPGAEASAYRPVERPTAAHGRMRELSPGKDTTTGHWELAGIVLDKPFPTYPNGFSQSVMDAFEGAIGRGWLYNRTASGTKVIADWGDEHVRTGHPIVYTSADSVFQIAMHEDVIPLEEQAAICRAARGILVGEHAVARVIMRPFTGASGAYSRTANRRDYSIEPFGETMLDELKREGKRVMGIGKIEDIFAMRGLTHSEHASGNAACMDAMMDALDTSFDGLVFTNLVDFDMLYGHRRDPAGFAAALAAFDARLPRMLEKLREGDLFIVTADHGCDPRHAGTDHTREYVPLLVYGGDARPLGTLAGFTAVRDIALSHLL